MIIIMLSIYLNNVYNLYINKKGNFFKEWVKKRNKFVPRGERFIQL